ncbi:carboxylate--amine ligase [Brachybacterium subflavum]|uniref:carboxylate--amine ligase n=1 Tax=Brachybacterium subflavum TaxID=2585206 RepID=UPI0012665421|nr:carboxylate--amine ligase [Brachybacterium subflavum]
MAPASSRSRGPAEPRDDFDLVMLGGDIGVYALARAFHEQYGTISHVITRSVSGPIADSRILVAEELGASATEDDLAAALLRHGRERAARRPGIPAIVLANADWLIALLSTHREELEEFFVLPVLDEETLRDVSDKATFSEICTTLGVSTPETVVVDFTGEGPTVIPELPFAFPVVAKPARSSAYTHVEFAGKKKVYHLTEPAELTDLVHQLDAAGFADRFVVQEMVPGDDTAMRSITAYVDQTGRVTLLGGAHVLLEEHTPGALGNPAAMFTADPGEIAVQAVAFLERTGYRGYANFDVKVDPRTGVAKFFEVNPRIGRNNYYMTAAGANVARAVVRDVVDHEQIERIVPDDEILYSIVPRPLLMRYVTEPGLRARVRRIARHRTVHPLAYATEGTRRRAYIAVAMANQVKKFLTHYPRPSSSGF